MIVKLLLDRKREGGELVPEEIRALIGAYTHGDVPDYQIYLVDIQPQSELFS